MCFCEFSEVLREWGVEIRLYGSYVLVRLTLCDDKQNLEIICLFNGCVWSLNLSVCAHVNDKMTLFLVVPVRSTIM